MNTAKLQPSPRPIHAMTAGDLMTAPVLTIPHDLSLREAARLLAGSHISGAPVVDTEGRCLGVISSSDFVTWAGEGSPEEGKSEKSTCFIAPWGEMIDIEDAPHDEIHHYMTARPVMVSPSVSVADLAQKMVDAHIHRVLVVGDQDRPRGIVTSTDILAALAQAAR
jgi:CBS domain-containing protein